MATPDEPFRLPRTVDPTRYQLTIAPDLEAATFEGRADIELDVREPCDVIVCNAAELTITAAWVESSPAGRQMTGAVMDEDEEQASFAPLRDFTRGGTGPLAL